MGECAVMDFGSVIEKKEIFENLKEELLFLWERVRFWISGHWFFKI